MATTTPICSSPSHDRTDGDSQRRRQREQRRAHRAARTERQPQRHRHEGRGAGRHGVAEVRDRERFRVPRPGIAGNPRRHRQGHPGRRRAPAVADRRRAGRSRAQGEHAARDHPDRSPRQLVPGALLLERGALRVRRRRNRTCGHRALGRAQHAQHLGRRRTGQGRRAPGARERRPRVVPLCRADGGSDLPRSGEAVRDRSPRRQRRLPQRVLRGDAAPPGRSSDRVARRQAPCERMGRRGARRDGGPREARPPLCRYSGGRTSGGRDFSRADRVEAVFLQGLRPPALPRTRPWRSLRRRTRAPVDARLHGLLHGHVGFCRAAGQRHRGAAVGGSAATGWHVDAHLRRHRLPRRASCAR